jgi:hypothetical protein
MRTGVLSVFDTDYATATALNIPCVTEVPFSAISPGAREDLGHCIAAVDAVVVTAMPIEQSNIDNTRVLKQLADRPNIIFAVNNGRRDRGSFQWRSSRDPQESRTGRCGTGR